MGTKVRAVRLLKASIVKVLGRERANRVSAPYHDWKANRRTAKFLKTLQVQNLLLNLGCGYRPMKGWINVDRARGPEVQVVWDLRKALPFPSDSCSAIFSEHVIEHIPKEDAQNLLNECHRVLQPGGILRLSTPDAEKFLRAYVNDDGFLEHPSFATSIDAPIDRVNEMMRECGQHLWSYDFLLLSIMLKRAEFSNITRQEFGESSHPKMRAIDYDARAHESIYVESVK